MEYHALIVTGTRPEVIKMAPVYHALKNNDVSVRWCHSGQHDTLADQAFKHFDISPDITLQRPKADDLSSLCAGLLAQLSTVISEEKPTCVLVHGDTSSTLAAAQAAFYHQIPIIAHVEAGLRSGNLFHPFPEEANRKQVATIASRHYPPTPRALTALLAENVNPDQILTTGNTVIDAQHYLIKQNKVAQPEDKHLVLVTAHRRENWENLPVICGAVNSLAKQRPDLTFIFATHPNPAVLSQVKQHLSTRDNIQLSEPMGYLELQQTLANAALVLTDSGGIQEEAPTYRVPVVVLRETTERPEACDIGIAILAGAANTQRILTAAQELLDRQSSFFVNPFGDGTAAEAIAKDIKELFNELP
ncbi:UDP-N-acetylglucosamine 2-epimerase (non-hydrolyzing) [Enterovibrio sp. ZSDZ35]|uniref:UDP-N-acetylglucosamine 2-epimerase (non-hydrolyzing) n=1 Tax=Enterovibrio qingdaonensis TaxID=2899818 RepID=A0ABT5QL46_9GAMM|nr:UDP-N-acetylglucosamine 2-epimerase (non-hydrolyzing) [Enterovibrio sp. ZSDZ35]MDD1781036.1 UDP-N-acetylglucosamine 2-epimerase (non-hydrolyzing) [Enterovibrio sp. ZSDZ35]